jgi:hypothetical protein
MLLSIVTSLKDFSWLQSLKERIKMDSIIKTMFCTLLGITKGLLMQHCTKRVQFITLFNYVVRSLSSLMQQLVEKLDLSHQLQPYLSRMLIVRSSTILSVCMTKPSICMTMLQFFISGAKKGSSGIGRRLLF